MPEYEVLAIAANSVKELSEKLNEHAKNGWLLFSFSNIINDAPAAPAYRALTVWVRYPTPKTDFTINLSEESKARLKDLTRENIEELLRMQTGALMQ